MFGEACRNAAQGVFSQPPHRSLEIRNKMEITTSSGAADFFFIFFSPAVCATIIPSLFLIPSLY